jgi:hypothetical protein
MPIKPKEEGYKKYLVYLKDVVYIIGIVVAMYGWISTKAKNEAVLETTIKYNTEIVKKLETFMDKQIELNGKQAELNGKYTQFITTHKE